MVSENYDAFVYRLSGILMKLNQDESLDVYMICNGGKAMIPFLAKMCWR